MAHQMDVSKGFEWVSDENNNVIIDIDTTDGHKKHKSRGKKKYIQKNNQELNHRHIFFF